MQTETEIQEKMITTKLEYGTGNSCVSFHHVPAADFELLPGETRTLGELGEIQSKSIEVGGRRVVFFKVREVQS